MLNKQQTKYQNTAKLMDEALIRLLEKKNYEFITVKEICTKAGVNRSTFYLHYETMDDLLMETLQYISRQMNNSFADSLQIDKQKILTCPLEELVLITPQYLVPYLQFVLDNKRVFIAAQSQPMVFQTKNIFNALYTEIFDPILTRYGIKEQDRQYLLSFYLNGMYGVLLRWIKNGCDQSVEYMANLLIDCVRPYHTIPQL